MVVIGAWRTCSVHSFFGVCYGQYPYGMRTLHNVIKRIQRKDTMHNLRLHKFPISSASFSSP
ncbi:predicted protein [Pyrenophora tritici-repentis Pt-1C-BFP]|uniref:Uncharacterized protein n=1 Tax=Pyrenophora tritici-repentis (strain Pt-1C-BFP) TaxID=426418 RepID=B2W216_PYRTR|nr:uncharacterized protein PTRG_03464 [Pyrenophora tritici-repentis Pt-1C-BFP]EDU46302.1 predicted protein [Pyrenophora tritici-repentis Pt-1C-BFP]